MSKPNNWWTSDGHFNHFNVNVYCQRPFVEPGRGKESYNADQRKVVLDAMHETMITNWNNLVQDDDTVWYLGDFSFGESALTFLSRLKGIKKLVAGNHDLVHPVNKKARKATDLQRYRGIYYRAGWAEIHLEIPSFTLANGTVVKMAHMPYAPWPMGKEDTRYLDWRPADEGGWLLCGHIHEKWKKRGKQINVGVDQWNFTPVSEAQIIEEIEKGPGEYL